MMNSLPTSIRIKHANRSRIFQMFLKNEACSKQDIITNLHLSLPTVTQNLNDLMQEGLIAESGSVGNTGGRRAKVFSVVKNARCAVGLDITRNHITAVTVNLFGEVIGCIRKNIIFEQTDTYYKVLADMVDSVITESNLAPSSILGVGIGVPGLIEEDNNRVFYGKILNFTGATASEFSSYIPYDTSLFNDANAAGYAEIWANKDIRNAFYVMLSNNIGGSILINNNIYSGENIRSGEVGHTTVVPKGERCYCGQRGCLDPYCAATVLSSLTDGNLDAFFERLKKGEPHIVRIWSEYLDYLAIAVNNLRVLFDCSVIVGGYVGVFMEDYLDDLKSRAAKLSTFEDNADYLSVCIYKTEAIAAGAALNFIAKFLKTI